MSDTIPALCRLIAIIAATRTSAFISVAPDAIATVISGTMRRDTKRHACWRPAVGSVEAMRTISTMIAGQYQRSPPTIQTATERRPLQSQRTSTFVRTIMSFEKELYRRELQVAHRRRKSACFGNLGQSLTNDSFAVISPSYLRIAHGHSGGARPDVVQNLTATNALSLIASNQLKLRTAFRISARPIQSTHMGRAVRYIRSMRENTIATLLHRKWRTPSMAHIVQLLGPGANRLDRYLSPLEAVESGRRYRPTRS